MLDLVPLDVADGSDGQAARERELVLSEPRTRAKVPHRDPDGEWFSALDVSCQEDHPGWTGSFAGLLPVLESRQRSTPR